MAEYIERKAALDAVHKWCDPCGAAVEAVLSVPTVDVAPVVHGRWEWDLVDVYRCSACGEKSRVKEVMGKPAWDFCPNCGAKMNGGDENAPD